MRRSLTLGASICTILIAFGGAATSAGPAFIKDIDRSQSLITKVIAGTDCAYCCEFRNEACQKWCRIACKDVVVISGVATNSKTGKTIQFKKIPGIDKAGTSK